MNTEIRTKKITSLKEFVSLGFEFFIQPHKWDRIFFGCFSSLFVESNMLYFTFVLFTSRPIQERKKKPPNSFRLFRLVWPSITVLEYFTLFSFSFPLLYFSLSHPVRIFVLSKNRNTNQ